MAGVFFVGFFREICFAKFVLGNLPGVILGCYWILAEDNRNLVFRDFVYYHIYE